MTGTTGPATFSKLLFGCYVCLSLVLIFYLPTLIGSKPGLSDSYVFGYNNHVGLGLLIASVALGIFWLLRAGVQVPLGGHSDQIKRRTLHIFTGVIAVWCSILYVLTARLGSFGESAYLINRIELCARGLVPYRDFEFAYGAAFLYLPIMLSRVTHLSLPNAYYAIWIITSIFGIWLLAYVIDHIDYPGHHRNQIFILYSSMFLVAAVTTGTNYTATRFLLSPTFALLSFRFIRQRSLRARVYETLGVAGFTLILVLVSPEIAIAFGLGMSATMLASHLKDATRRWAIPYIAMISILVCLFVVADHFQVFKTLKSFGSGGDNLPIVPAPYILLFFFSIFVSTYCVACLIFKGEIYSNSIPLIAVSIPLLASALGHCDPGHVLLNGFSFSLIALLWASHSPWIWRWYRLAFILIFCGLSCLTFLFGYIGPLSKSGLVLLLRSPLKANQHLLRSIEVSMNGRYGTELALEKLAELQMLTHADATRDTMPPPMNTVGIVEAPFGYTVTQNPTYVDEGYYAGTVNAFSSESIMRKVQELEQHPTRDILIPRRVDCYVDLKGEQKFLSILFFYPFHRRALHSQDTYEPLCRHIRQHYWLRVPSRPDTYGFEIWSPLS